MTTRMHIVNPIQSELQNRAIGLLGVICNITRGSASGTSRTLLIYVAHPVNSFSVNTARYFSFILHDSRMIQPCLFKL